MNGLTARIIRFNEEPRTRIPREHVIDLSLFSNVVPFTPPPAIMHRRSAHCNSEIARIKALLTVMTVPSVSRLTGISQVTLRDWKSGKYKNSVLPDYAILKSISKLALTGGLS